jgi:hypothetical protein
MLEGSHATARAPACGSGRQGRLVPTILIRPTNAVKTLLRSERFEKIAVLSLAVPVLGILLGGVYSLPAIHLVKDRDPWLTLALAGGLTVTVFGVGWMAGALLLPVAAVWLIGIILLLFTRTVYGRLGRDLERFGIVHAITLLLTIFVIAVTRYTIQRGA